MPGVGSSLVVAGALVDGGRLLLAQRAHPPELAGLWELPGGKVEPGETAAAALRRELDEELGITVTVGTRIDPPVPLAGGLTLIAHRVRLVAGRPRAREHRGLRWVDAAGLGSAALVPADRAWLPALTAMLGHDAASRPSGA